MASKSILQFKRIMKNDTLKELKEIASNKQKMYNSNSVKAAKQLILERKK